MGFHARKLQTLKLIFPNLEKGNRRKLIIMVEVKSKFAVCFAISLIMEVAYIRHCFHTPSKYTSRSRYSLIH